MNLAMICLRCPHRPRPYTGKAKCVDGVTTDKHVAAWFCPMGLFPANLPDDDAAVAEIKEQETRRAKAGGCCGKPSSSSSST